MIYTGDIGLYLSGSPVPVPSCMIVVTQPTIRQIAQMGEDDFLMGVQLFARSEQFITPVREGNPGLEGYSDFQILLTMIHQDAGSRRFFDALTSLAFPQYDVHVKPMSLDFYLKDSEDEAMVGQVTPFSFEALSTCLGELFLSKDLSPASDDYDPANDKAKEIAEKLRRGRERVQRQKGMKDSGGRVSSLFGNYASILSVGMSMDINIFFSYTPFQLYDAFTRYLLKVASDFYRKVSTTPLMDVSKMDVPEEWTKNLYPMEKFMR